MQFMTSSYDSCKYMKINKKIESFKSELFFVLYLFTKCFLNEFWYRRSGRKSFLLVGLEKRRISLAGRSVCRKSGSMTEKSHRVHCHWEHVGQLSAEIVGLRHRVRSSSSSWIDLSSFATRRFVLAISSLDSTVFFHCQRSSNLKILLEN